MSKYDRGTNGAVTNEPSVQDALGDAANHKLLKIFAPQPEIG